MTKDMVGMKDGTVLVNVHTVDQCAGQPCCIHNPSNHHMAQWSHSWDDTYGVMWRKCPHGNRHPDPDDLDYRRNRSMEAARIIFSHVCDGCCQPSLKLFLNAPKEIEQTVGKFLFDPQTGELRQRPER